MKRNINYKYLEDRENYFSTYDLGCVSSLVSVGHRIFHTEKVGGTSRVLFVFEMTDEILMDSQKYWSGELEVDAQTYFNTLKNLKSRIYST